MEWTEYRRMVASGLLTEHQSRNLALDFSIRLLSGIDNDSALDLRGYMSRSKLLTNRKDKVAWQAELVDDFLKHGGIGWYNHSDFDRQKIVIYWPAFLRVGFFDPQSFQAQSLWLFQRLVRRRSPLLFSLLRRKVITETVHFSVDTTEAGGEFIEKDLLEPEAFKHVIPVDAEEVELFNRIAEQFCEMKELGFAFKRMFTGLFESLQVEEIDYDYMRNLFRAALPINSRMFAQMSVFARYQLLDFREILRRRETMVIPDAEIQSFGFGSHAASKDLYDVLAVPHYAHPSGIFGVYRVRKGSVFPENYMLVNLPMYIRQLAREDMFSHVSSFYHRYAERYDMPTICKKVKASWMARYPLMVSTGAYTFGGDTVWPTAEESDLFAVPVDAFETYRKKAAALESRRQTKAKTSDKELVRQPGFRRILQLSFGPFSETGDTVFVMRVFFRKRTLFISPMWETLMDERQLVERNYVEVGETLRLKEGIMRNEATKEYYYSWPLYRLFKDTPVDEYSALRDSIDNYANGLTLDEYSIAYRNIRHSPTREAFAPGRAMSRAMSEVPLFTVSDDNLIREKFRPDTAAEVFAQLVARDPLKTRKIITARAQLLREGLIEKGVYDINKLPHINYSAKLGKRLKALKALKERKLNASDETTS